VERGKHFSDPKPRTQLQQNWKRRQHRKEEGEENDSSNSSLRKNAKDVHEREKPSVRGGKAVWGRGVVYTGGEIQGDGKSDPPYLGLWLGQKTTTAPKRKKACKVDPPRGNLEEETTGQNTSRIG